MIWFQYVCTGKSLSEAPIYSRNSLLWTKWLEDGATLWVISDIHRVRTYPEVKITGMRS